MSYKHAIPKEVPVEDRYGDQRIVHYRNGKWAVKRTGTTPALALNQAVSQLMGQRIKEFRLARNLTLEELCLRAGLRGTPKARMWEIENGVRQNGTRLGTLYALAMALGVEPAELMPSLAEIEMVARPTTEKRTVVTLNTSSPSATRTSVSSSLAMTLSAETGTKVPA